MKNIDVILDEFGQTGTKLSHDINTEVLSPVLRILNLIDAIVEKMNRGINYLGNMYHDFRKDHIQENLTTLGTMIFSNFLIKQLQKKGLEDSWLEMLLLMDDKPTWLDNKEGMVVVVNKAFEQDCKIDSSKVIGTSLDKLLKDKVDSEQWCSMSQNASDEETSILFKGDDFVIICQAVNNRAGKHVGNINYKVKTDNVDGFIESIKGLDVYGIISKVLN